MPLPATLFRLAAGLVGLLALWIGCDLTSQPLRLGGPMNLSFNLPFGVPLVILGVIGVALAPARCRRVAWLLAAFLSLSTAGVNVWQHIPVEDGAFQSLRAGVPDPDTWPAPAFLCALALAPVGIALAALLPGAQRSVPLLLVSGVAAIAAGLGLQAFAGALLQQGAGRVLIIGTVAVLACVALVAMRGGHPAGRAFAGQAVVLAALCVMLWSEYARAA